MDLFDTHCHLDAEVFDADRADVITRAQAAGVSRIVCIGANDGSNSAHQALKLAKSSPNIWASVGIHPHDAGKDCKTSELKPLALDNKVVAIGETGLDYFYDFGPKELQTKIFREQINLAREVKKPLIIHCRNAAEDTLRILIEEQARDVGGVFHCYSETEDFAKKLFDINFIVSFPGILTFKKSIALQTVAAALPLDKIMLETDAPFLAPEPYRGKRCEPAFVLQTAIKLATLHHKTPEYIASVTTENALRFFSIKI